MKGKIFMKGNMKSTKRIAASILAATLIGGVPAANLVPGTYLTVAASTNNTLPHGMKEVVDEHGQPVKGDLTISIPDNVSENYEVKAYELLQLVIPVDTTWTAGTKMTNNDNSQNVYVVTDNFEAFFAKAKKSYTKKDSELPSSETLYLTYDVANKSLNITNDVTTVSDKTENKDYIVIDNTAYSAGHKGRLDTKYFEADLVSRITDSPEDATETTASAARLLSDWASRYIKDKNIEEDKTADKITGEKVFRFSGETALVYGYYVLVTSDTSTNSEGCVVNQSILNVPHAEGVTLKATPITIDKSVSNLVDANRNNNGEREKKNTETTRRDEDETNGENYDMITANIGDVLQYKIESHIPSLTSYDLETAKTSGKLLGLTDGDEITESNFIDKIANNYVYTFRDTMINQNFIPADTTVAGVDVNGLKMEIHTEDENGRPTVVTYVVKKLGDINSPEYYLVEENTKETADKDSAIGRIWETDYAQVDGKWKNFFVINFDLVKLKKLGYDGRDVVFTYNAELMGEAGNSDATNEGTFTYSNDPYDASSTDTITDKNKVFTYDIKIDKKFSDGAKNLFGNVKFKLYSDSAKSHVINFKGSDGSYTRTDSDDSPVQDGILSLSSTGTLELHGLGEGTYYLEEQPNNTLKNAGYNVVNIITIVVTAKGDNGTITDSEKLDLFNGDNTGSSATLDGVSLNLGVLKESDEKNNEYGIEFDVVNQKGFKLPLTGEYGNRALAVAGIVLVAVGGTVIVLVNRKKKDTSAKNEA